MRRGSDEYTKLGPLGVPKGVVESPFRGIMNRGSNQNYREQAESQLGEADIMQV